MRWTPMLKWPGNARSLILVPLVVLTVLTSANAGFDLHDDDQDIDRRISGIADASDYIVDIREYDVPYHVRVAIDKGGK